MMLMQDIHSQLYDRLQAVLLDSYSFKGLVIADSYQKDAIAFLPHGMLSSVSMKKLMEEFDQFFYSTLGHFIVK